MTVLDAREDNALRTMAVPICQELKADPVTSTVPVLILVHGGTGAGEARAGTGSDTHDLCTVRALEAGADDVIGNAMGPQERDLRMALLLQRSRRDLGVHPATRLPSGEEVRRQTEKRLERAEPFSVGYADLDHFKEFNDAFGYAEGDRVIVRLAGILRSTVRRIAPGGFVGHIGGDDFVFLVPAGWAVACCNRILRVFAESFRAHLPWPCPLGLSPSPTAASRALPRSDVWPQK